MPDYLRFVTILVWLLPSLTGWANSTPLALQNVNGSVIGNSTLITLELDRPPVWNEVGVPSRGSSLELHLPNTITDSAGKFQPISNSPYILKLLPLQLDAHTTSLRIFANTAGKLLRQATTVEVAGKQIIVFVDHSKLQQVLQGKPSPPITSASGNWTEKIQLAALALIAVLTLLLGWFGLRRLWRKQQVRENVPSAVLRNIGQLSLSPQQHLTLVEVYGQRMLFAVSEQRVELLTEVTLNTASLATGENKPSGMLPMSAPPTQQLDHDIYLNQNNLSAQKSIQRSPQYRETLPRVAAAEQQQPVVAQNGNNTGLPKSSVAG